MEDWIKEKLTARERILYRIAMRNAKDPELVDDLIYRNLIVQPERLNPEDHFVGVDKVICDSPNRENK